ncbi:hypothetical protein Tco_1162175 [Tanacetum coccineum]
MEPICITPKLLIFWECKGETAHVIDGPPEPGTQAGVVVLEKHDDCPPEEAEGEEDEIFLFLYPDGNIAPYASHGYYLHLLRLIVVDGFVGNVIEVGIGVCGYSVWFVDGILLAKLDSDGRFSEPGLQPREELGRNTKDPQPEMRREMMPCGVFNHS